MIKLKCIHYIKYNNNVRTFFSFIFCDLNIFYCLNNDNRIRHKFYILIVLSSSYTYNIQHDMYYHTMENMSGRSQQLYILFFTNSLFYILKYENIFVGKSEDESCTKILEAESDVLKWHRYIFLYSFIVSLVFNKYNISLLKYIE